MVPNYKTDLTVRVIQELFKNHTIKLGINDFLVQF